MSVRRIKVGPVGGAFGLWMSKPGVDVQSAGPGDLLFSPAMKFLQVIHERHVTLEQTERSSLLRVLRRIDHPNFGFVPLVTIDCTSKTYEFPATNPSRNMIANPFSRYPFGQTSTGFYCVWHTLEAYISGSWHYISQGGSVTIRLYNVATQTSGYAAPAHDLLVPDA